LRCVRLRRQCVIKRAASEGPLFQTERLFVVAGLSGRICPEAALSSHEGLALGSAGVLVGRARQLTELRLECIEVDRLSEELGSAKLTCPASALVVAIGGHHHHRDVGEALFDGFEEL